MSDRSNMYSRSVAQWSPWAGCEHECSYCKLSFQAQLKRWAKKNCCNCYTFTPHEHRERLTDKLPSTRFMQFIFTCSSGDIACCPTPYLREIAAVMQQQKDKTFLLQTKDPRVLHQVPFPENVVLGITLETNRDALCLAVSKAPPPSQRYKVFAEIKHPRKMVTIEPVMDFDHDVMVRWLQEINPCLIWLGYDSRSSGLSEPELAKVKELYWELGKRGFMVALKTIREANRRASRERVTRSRPTEEGSAPLPATETGDWDLEAIRQWARTARPSSRLAMWYLAQGNESTVTELNTVVLVGGLPDAKGAIVGGINAVATRNRRRHAVEHAVTDGSKVFAIRRQLQPLFREVLAEYPEARLLGYPPAEDPPKAKKKS